MTTNETSDRQLEMVLDQLSLPWEDIVKAVEQRSDRPVIRTCALGFQNVKASAN